MVSCLVLMCVNTQLHALHVLSHVKALYARSTAHAPSRCMLCHFLSATCLGFLPCVDVLLDLDGIRKGT